MTHLLSVSVLLVMAACPPKEPAKPVDPVKAAFDKLVNADKDWRATEAAKQELAALGSSAVNIVRLQAEHHADARVRSACIELITDKFASDPWAINVLIRSVVHDKDPGIRYHCAYRLGELRVYHAHRELRQVMNDATGKDQEYLRFAAAKSLAQLGEADVLRTLYEAVTSDGYMARSMGNIGLKALSGKSLDDFEGYKFGEGAMVSGGHEYICAFDAITAAETRAKRYQAATAYFKWLKKERPELYKHVTYY